MGLCSRMIMGWGGSLCSRTIMGWSGSLCLRTIKGWGDFLCSRTIMELSLINGERSWNEAHFVQELYEALFKNDHDIEIMSRTLIQFKMILTIICIFDYLYFQMSIISHVDHAQRNYTKYTSIISNFPLKSI